MQPPSGPSPQQTVRLAIDSQTSELVPAETLLAMPEDEFSGLRR